MAAGNNAAAHTALEDVRIDLMKLRSAQGVDYFMDRLTAFHEPMEVLALAGNTLKPQDLTPANAQSQYYLTDIVAAAARAGEVRTITTTPADPEYELLGADVTRPADLAVLERVLETREAGQPGPGEDVESAAQALVRGRPAVQVLAIARQLTELAVGIARDKIGFQSALPVGIGVSGGRLRIAFMHPDMARFYGPAWQMPIGAKDEFGDEQIVMLIQEADDRRLHLYPLNPRYRESVNALSSDADVMYPGESVADLHTYETFGTRMSETLLLSLGYFSDAELADRRRRGLPLPPASLWVSHNMRRPFALVGNAIASLRTLRDGPLGRRVQERLGRTRFNGLRVVCTGGIPQGGFSSSSAVTVAVKNALDALYALGIPPDLLVHLACQAEYGTGVRAGSLDQATEQKGQAGRGTLISSNPRDQYRVLGDFPVPADRFRILFPFSVERDREAWRWSHGFFAESPDDARLTAGEVRKMTGKAAEIAALLLRLPLGTSFFNRIEADLLEDGALSRENRVWIAGLLHRLPLRISRDALRRQAEAARDWYRDQIRDSDGLDEASAARQADAAIASLFEGWRDPVFARPSSDGAPVDEAGVPLRAMLGYLFGEVVKNFRLIHHPALWIESVTASQRGDRCLEIDPACLPDRAALEREQPWERGLSGPDRLTRWLEVVGAAPFDFNRGLDDAALTADEPPAFDQLPGSSFFRGLALIDLAEAMLKRAFGETAVAVRVNAAGQGDYFQVHVDAERADPAAVKSFIRTAFYRRFGLTPDPEFVEPYPGGGAAGVRLAQYETLSDLVRRLRELAGAAG